MRTSTEHHTLGAVAIGLVAAVLFAGLCTPPLAADNPLRTCFPYGVYVGGNDPEWRGQIKSEEDLRIAIDRVCADLAAHHMNCAWPNNLSPKYVPLWLEAGRRNGVRIVPQGGGPPMFVRPDWFSNPEDFARQVEPFWEDMATKYRDDTALLAWSLTEENQPVPWFYDAIASLTRKMEQWDPAHPMITLDNRVSSAWMNATVVKPKAFCRDIYPFFGDGLNGPYEPTGFHSLLTRECGRFRAFTALCDAVYWHMGQAGQITGFGPGQETLTLRTPTPAEIRWQVWSAIQQGAKGFFFYLYAGPRVPEDAEAMTFDEGFRDRTGAETAQYTEAAVVGRQLEALAPVLLQLDPAPPHQDVVYWENTPVTASTFVHRQTGQRFVIAVNNDCERMQRVGFELGIFIQTVKPDEKLYDLKTRQSYDYDTIKLTTLQPGDGTVYLVGTDEDWQALTEQLYRN